MFFDKNFLQVQETFLQHIKTGSGACPASYSVDTRSKLDGAWVDHLPPSSAKVKNEWSYIPTPPICCHDIKRDNIMLHYIALH